MVRNENYVLSNGNIVRDIWDIDENMKILMKKNNCQFKARVKFGQKLAVHLSFWFIIKNSYGNPVVFKLCAAALRGAVRNSKGAAFFFVNTKY